MTVLLSTYILNDGDAIGNDLLGMARTVTDAGYEVRLFAEKAHVEADVFPLDELHEHLDEPDTVLIHHHSLQCDRAVRAVELFPTRSVVKYHNTTPSHYFQDVNPEVVRRTEQGQQQARRLAKLGIPFWVDSDFNGRELANDASGFRYDVLPPFHQTESLRGCSPDADSLAGLDDWTTTLLCVGRVAPNKNLELAIETLAKVRLHDPNTRLLIAGEHGFPNYSNCLRQLATEFGVADAMIVTGRVTNAQLKALYLSADVLLVTSHHEGFCVPLVEAMGLRVPTVAVPRTAIPDTGGTAVAYAEDADGLASAAIAMIRDGELRADYLLRGIERYREHFSTMAIREQFWQLLARDLPGRWHTGGKISAIQTCTTGTSSNKL